MWQLTTVAVKTRTSWGHCKCTIYERMRETSLCTQSLARLRVEAAARRISLSPGMQGDVSYKQSAMTDSRPEGVTILRRLDERCASRLIKTQYPTHSRALRRSSQTCCS